VLWVELTARNQKRHSRNHVDLLPLLKKKTQRFAYRLVTMKCYLQKSTGHACNDADIIEFLSFRHKLPIAGDLNVKYLFWNSAPFNSSAAKLLNLLHKMSLIFQHHNIPLIAPLREMVTCSILLCTRMSVCQKALPLTFWTQITTNNFPSAGSF
jgi:hypothetical protein